MNDAVARADKLQKQCRKLSKYEIKFGGELIAEL